MSRREQDPNSGTSANRPTVPRWTDWLSGLQARHPRLFIGLGNFETRVLTERLQRIAIDRPIFVTGLARAGTTKLLELLARHPDCATHRYRDFPPVLLPAAWNWFVDRAEQRPAPAEERAHADGIAVTSESPEAFEEVVWMAFFPDLHDPQCNAVLAADEHHQAFEQFYRDHIRKLLLVRGGRRYLSKANYHVTRLPYLARLFPDARFVIPVRDPVWHIASLMKQHRLFCADHRRDPRTLRHMDRAGHFEFGLDRRPINCGDDEATRRIAQLWQEGREVEGWATYWAVLHMHIARVLAADPGVAEAVFVVGYERLCAEPVEMLGAVLEHVGLTPNASVLDEAATLHLPNYYRPAFDDAELATIARITEPARELIEPFFRTVDGDGGPAH